MSRRGQGIADGAMLVLRAGCRYSLYAQGPIRAICFGVVDLVEEAFLKIDGGAKDARNYCIKPNYERRTVVCTPAKWWWARKEMPHHAVFGG